MFNELERHLKQENEWLKGQVELLQNKLFKALRLNELTTESTVKRPMKYDTASKTYVPKSDAEIQADIDGLRELNIC